MAKNRNKKNKNGRDAMDVSSDQAVSAMDTSESSAPKSHLGGSHRKMKGVPMKRSKNVRKKKAIAKAISKNEKLGEKITRSESKIERIRHAKKLYE